MKTHVVFVVDKSGSMSCVRQKANSVLDNLVKNIAKNGRKFKQESYVTIVEFGDSADIVILNKKPRDVDYTLHIGGMTAMWDGIGLGVNTLANWDSPPKDAFLVYVITDGCENNSRTYNNCSIQKLMADKIATDRWTFAFQVPAKSVSTLTRFGISRDNIEIWDGTNEGLKEVEEKTSSGLSSYYLARSTGETKVDKFYVNIDTSNLKKKEVDANLYDYTKQYKTISVNKCSQIKDVVEKMIGSYTKGEAFYQLTKKENVQAYKEVLVKDKKTGTVWGGIYARQLIGLPQDAEARVNPVAFGQWELYVQSTSVNRKILAGTNVMVKK